MSRGMRILYFILGLIATVFVFRAQVQLNSGLLSLFILIYAARTLGRDISRTSGGKWWIGLVMTIVFVGLMVFITPDTWEWLKQLIDNLDGLIKKLIHA